MSENTLSWQKILTSKPFLVFGILNVTPDSFSDGNQYTNRANFKKHILELLSEGSDVIDVGAESTRPGALEVPSIEEIQRLENVFNYLDSNKIEFPLFSIDTRHADTAKSAIDHGFKIVNDVSGTKFDPNMADVMAASKSLVILMHSRGNPENMNELANYENVVDEVISELQERCDYVISRGVLKENVMLDPGIGFAKTPEHNIELLDSISKIKEVLGFPIMVGVSRKTVTSYMLTGDPHNASFSERDHISAQIAVKLRQEGVDAVRVHNVALTKEMLAIE